MNYFISFLTLIIKLAFAVDDADMNSYSDEGEVLKTGILSEIFNDEIIKHSTIEIGAHVSSSTENLIDLFEKEQILISKLISFLKMLSTEEFESGFLNLQKMSKSITSLNKFYIKTQDGENNPHKR